MFNYDPDNQPDSQTWLSLKEADRMASVEKHHKTARIKLPNTRAHAAFHIIVENQIAEKYEPTVRAMERLTREGLSRHDALHAIGSVVTEHMFDLLKAKKPDPPEVTQALISAAIERLTAKDWLQRFGK